MCGWEGEGDQGGLVDELEARDDMHGEKWRGGGGGLVDEVAHNRCGGGGEGVRMPMDD